MSPTMQYEERVSKMRTLTSRSEADQWEAARLTHETLMSGADKAQFAKDCGLSIQRVNDFFKVWDRYSDPATRVADRSFNDHIEVARVTDEKAREIIAHAEKTGVTIGIARKTISREETKRRTAAQIAAEAVAAERAKAEEADLAAALADSGNHLAAHEAVIACDREEVIERRQYDSARQATQPLMAAAATVRVMGASRAASDLLATIEQANDSGVAVPNSQEIIASLNKALEAIVFNAALHGSDVVA